MKIKIFGTAAAEGFPAMFCECEHCNRARKSGGRNLRTRSQALVDDTLLIDFGPDTLSHTLYGGLDLTKVTDLLITHNHCDHLLTNDFENRKDGYCQIKNKKPLNIYATTPAIEKIGELCSADKKISEALILNEVTPFNKYKIGRYTVYPLKADHDPQTAPVFYLISNGEKNLLYATDTGRFPKETVDFLRDLKIKTDIIFIDCTAILLTGWSKSHMGLDTNILQIEELKQIGVVDNNTKVVLHHFSHNGGATYDELVPIAARYGFLVSFDGMIMEV